MQQLHLVGFTTDHKGLILGTRRGTEEGSYVVTLDRAFVDQVEQLLRLQAGEGSGGDAAANAAGNGSATILRRPKTESRLTPRQVQALLRTGSSVSEVAEEAGMSEDWVGRFAPPVLAEQARVVERAIGLSYVKPKIGPSTQSLGESVLWNLAERGIVLSNEAVEDAWSAFQQSDGGWVVRVAYLAERRRQHADWTIDMSKGVVKAVNRLANELGFVEPGRRRPAALPPPAPVSISAQRAAAGPPRPTPAPPPATARPSGRLSMLAPGMGLSRVAPPVRVPRGPDREPAPVSDVTAGGAPAADKAGDRARETPPAAAKGARGRDDAGGGGRERTSEEATGTKPAPERRPRPLRPVSVDSSLAGRGPRAGSSAAPGPAGADRDKAAAAGLGGADRDKAAAGLAGAGRDKPAAGGARTMPAGAPPGPRRERPLRAPSRIRRDELAQPPTLPPPTTRRPVGPPSAGALKPRVRPPEQAPDSPVASRFGPAHPPSERKTSTAERFGIGYPDRAPEAETAAPEPEAVPNNHVTPYGEQRLTPRRPLRARPLVVDDGLDDDDLAFAEAEDDPGPRARSADPITAPVPAVEIFDDLEDLDDEAFTSFGPEDAPPSGDVLIRTGKARAANEPVARSGRPRANPEERQGRLARRKARRRDDSSS